jgi:hypothetical protein
MNAPPEDAMLRAVTTPLMLQFLDWLASQPRTYGEAMEAWRTNCPRLTIWEDAIDGGLVKVESAEGRGMKQANVVLTAQGRALLAPK